MRMVKKAAYLAWLLLAGALFGLFIAGCQTDSPDSDNDNKTENPSDNPADNPSGGNEIGSVFGVYTNPKTGLKYAFNEDGTYSISKNDTSIESGTFKNQNDVTSNIRGIVARAMREQSAKSVKYGYLLTPKNMGGAKASEKNPRNSKITVIKTKNPGAIFGNTPMFTEKDLKEIAEKPAVTVWIQAENLPKVSYNVTSDTTVEKITDAISSKNESSRWFKYYFENCSEISLNVNYGSDTKSFDVANSTVYISKDKNILTEKPEDFTFDENYKSSSDKLYLMGTFAYQDEADNAEQTQWKAIDGFNDFKEIDKNIYKLSMYLPQNIYGFKISMTGFSYDYCIPFEVKGSVQKNKWFEIVKSEYSTWYGKNGALATGGGYYNFFLDLSDEAKPVMLVATDEQSDKVIEDANLYVVGDFTGWKFDEKYQLAETEKGSGIYSLTESVEIPASKDGKKQGFKISDKTWGAMTGEYGQNRTRGTANIELKENQYVDVDETYATRTQNNNLEYSFNGTYNFYLNVNTSQLKIENPNASTPEQKPEPKIATIYFYDSNGNLTNKTHNAKVGTQITEEILNKYSSESDIFGWYIKDTNKKLELPFPITSDLDIYPRLATTFAGGWVKNYLGKIKVKPGNFYMCEIKGHTVTELNGWTDFATENADSYGSNEFRWAADSEFTITSVCYAYNSGYANMSLKMANKAKVLIDSVRFDKVTLADDSEYGLSYGDNKWETLVASEETGNLECTLTLVARESIKGKFYNHTHDINLLYNSIDYVSNGLELTPEDDNSFTVKNTSYDTDLNVTFSMNPTTLKVSLLLKDSMQQIELFGDNVENMIGTYDVEAGNFYKCTLSGISNVSINGILRTEEKDSIGYGSSYTSEPFTLETYCYAYKSGKASFILKTTKTGTISSKPVTFEKITPNEEMIADFTLEYNDGLKSEKFKPNAEDSSKIECSYFLGANSSFEGKIYNWIYRLSLLSNAIDSYPNELTLSEKGDNLVIKNNTATDLNLTFSLNTGTRKVTLTTEEISAPEFNGNWYSYEIDTTEISDETISLIFNESEANEIGNEIHTKIQSLDITNVQKEGAVYYEWQNSSEAYYKSTRTDKPETNIEAEKLKVFVYTDATAADLHLYYWSESYKELDWPGVTMTPVSTSAGE
ncbi:hypothetical protein [uncultured Treponema sp.]|uniref:hypothetical protein n=1 Tax=uncultured Treponema sp. TaxID=162155 RepID=UPI0025987FAB|nr:hypothetical protein [uncultured Treponema sp.]